MSGWRYDYATVHERLAFLDGWALARLGLPRPDRDVPIHLEKFVAVAFETGRREAGAS